jgi:hypothetical protein
VVVHRGGISAAATTMPRIATTSAICQNPTAFAK